MRPALIELDLRAFTTTPPTPLKPTAATSASASICSRPSPLRAGMSRPPSQGGTRLLSASCSKQRIPSAQSPARRLFSADASEDEARGEGGSGGESSTATPRRLLDSFIASGTRPNTQDSPASAVASTSAAVRQGSPATPGRFSSRLGPSPHVRRRSRAITLASVMDEAACGSPFVMPRSPRKASPVEPTWTVFYDETSANPEPATAAPDPTPESPAEEEEDEEDENELDQENVRPDHPAPPVAISTSAPPNTAPGPSPLPTADTPATADAAEASPAVETPASPLAKEGTPPPPPVTSPSTVMETLNVESRPSDKRRRVS